MSPTSLEEVMVIDGLDAGSTSKTHTPTEEKNQLMQPQFSSRIMNFDMRSFNTCCVLIYWKESKHIYFLEKQDFPFIHDLLI
jgi:hypothetical protein